jgi:hypothetical protein
MLSSNNRNLLRDTSDLRQGFLLNSYLWTISLAVNAKNSTDMILEVSAHLYHHYCKKCSECFQRISRVPLLFKLKEIASIQWKIHNYTCWFGCPVREGVYSRYLDLPRMTLNTGSAPSDFEISKGSPFHATFSIFIHNSLLLTYFPNNSTNPS